MRLILLLLATMLIAACDRQKAEVQQGESAEAGLSKGVDRGGKGKPAPAVLINDPQGREVRLAEFAGKPLLVNLWASWCAPCVKELPTLDELAADGAGNKLQVLAVSQDSAPQGSVVAFLEHHKLRQLEPYHDPEMRLSSGLGVQVMPTTVLYGSDGREIWRYIGDLDWTGPEAAKLLAEAR